MNWVPDIPFPAEEMGRCRGCDASIGWIHKREDGRAHPVEVKGFEGVECPRGTIGSKSGWTLDGDHLVVRAPVGGLLDVETKVVVFESHFGHCPKADRFRRPQQTTTCQRVNLGRAGVIVCSRGRR